MNYLGRSWLALALVACSAAPVERDPNDPYAWLRCRDAGRPATQIQDTLLGAWHIAYRLGSRSDTSAVGEMRFWLMGIRPDISVGRHVCKDCLVGEYLGPFDSFLKRPPPSRNLLALMRADHTFIVSTGSASPRPNLGDLALCGAMLDDTLTGLWWQNFQDGPWGTFVMWRR